MKRKKQTLSSSVPEGFLRFFSNPAAEFELPCFCQRKLRKMGRGGRHRGRSQRKDFKESRENVWKRPKSDTTVDGSDNAVPEQKPTWEPIVTVNPNFEEYYKVT